MGTYIVQIPENRRNSNRKLDLGRVSTVIVDLANELDLVVPNVVTNDVATYAIAINEAKSTIALIRPYLSTVVNVAVNEAHGITLIQTNDSSRSNSTIARFLLNAINLRPVNKHLNVASWLQLTFWLLSTTIDLPIIVYRNGAGYRNGYWCGV